jgi:hypothetical protein
MPDAREGLLLIAIGERREVERVEGKWAGECGCR